MKPMDATSLSPVYCGNAESPTAEGREPTIGELLADPLTRALMEADRVDAQDFAQMLQFVGGRLQASGHGAARPIVTLEATASDNGDQAACHSQHWILDLPVDHQTARSLQGAIAAKAADFICGSNCAW
jgi:hypothetical protein